MTATTTGERYQDLGRVPPRPANMGSVPTAEERAACDAWCRHLGDWIRPYLWRELRLIENGYVRRAVLLCYQMAPRHYATQPASGTGKFHPPDERGEGGQILHTRRVVRLARELADAEEIAGYELDLLTGAALIHDLAKYGLEDAPAPWTQTGHEQAVARVVEWGLERAASERAYTSHDPAIEEQVGKALDAMFEIARHHSGRWGPRIGLTSEREARLGRLLHYADLIASRNWVSVQLGY